jgi:hypothetical protein
VRAALEQFPLSIRRGPTSILAWLHSLGHLPHGPLQIIDLLALVADRDAIISTITFYLNLFNFIFVVRSTEYSHG